MKKIFLLLIILILPNISPSQAPSIQWQQSYGGTNNDTPLCMRQTTDGGYVIAGYTYSNNGHVTGFQAGFDFWIVKLNADGSLQWQKALGGNNFDRANCIEQTSDGGYIVAGYSNSTTGDINNNHGGYDYWVVKLSSAGVMEWQKSYGGTGDEQAFGISQTIEGGYIVTGISFSNNGDVTGNHGGGDSWNVKLNSAGTIEWQKTVGGTNKEWSYAIKQIPDGSYIVAGESNSNNGDISGNHGDIDASIYKLSSTGTVVWQKSFGGTLFDYTYDIQQTTDGGYIAVGGTYSTNGDITSNHGNRDIWVIKLTPLGAIDWQKTYGGSSYEHGSTIRQTADGGYLVTGTTSSTDGDVVGLHGPTFTDAWLIKISNFGLIQWQRPYGGTNAESGYSGVGTIDGGYVFTSTVSSADGDATTNYGNSDFWVVKLGPDTLGMATNIYDNSLLLYPNPVQDIIYFQTESVIILAVIYDLLGCKIRTYNIINNSVYIGDLANGNYLLKTYSSDGMYTNKIIKY